jgi:hypothetical protein
MNRAKAILIQVITSVPIVMMALPAFAGGGGGGGGGGGSGTGAPEPSFLAMCAIVAGTELGRRVLKKHRKKI